MAEEFRPDWCLAPAATLREWMREHGATVGDLSLGLSKAARMSRDQAASLIKDALDRQPLTDECADILAMSTGTSAAFWRGLESNYRAGLAAGLADTTPED